MSIAKRALAATLAFSCVLTMTACGAPKASSQASTEGSKAESAASNTAPIKIGMYGALTGPTAQTGQNYVEGAKIAVEEINANGGVNGRPIEFILYDNAGTADGAVKAVTRLIDVDKVVAILGCHLSPNVMATAPITEKAKILHLGNGVAASLTNAGYKYLYRGTTSAGIVLKTVADTAKDRGVKTTAVLHSDTEMGQSGFKVMEPALKENGIEILTAISYQVPTTDFTGHIAKLLEKKPESLTLIGTIADMSLMIKQVRQAGFKGLIFMEESGVSKELLNVAGEAANGVISGAAYYIPETIDQAPTELEKKFLTAYSEKNGKLPIFSAIYRSYNGMYLIAEALKTAENMDDRESVAAAFKNIKGYEAIGGTFDYTDGSGDGLFVANRYMILNGSIQPYDAAAMDKWVADNAK